MTGLLGRTPLRVKLVAAVLVLVAVALANRMARTAWALMRKGEDYRDPAMATA